MWLTQTVVFSLYVGWSLALSNSELPIFAQYNVTIVEEIVDGVNLLDFTLLPSPEDGEQLITLRIPRSPQFLEEPACVPVLLSGVSRNGGLVLGPYFPNGTSAVPDEAPAQCNDEPDRVYRRPPQCFINKLLENRFESEVFFGVALDGFPIYATKEGYNITGLDQCNGKRGGDEYAYRYYLTPNFPYTPACLVGKVFLPEESPVYYNPGLISCYFNNVTHPAGVTDLTSAKLNNGDEDFSSSNNNNNGGSSKDDDSNISSCTAPSFLILFATAFLAKIKL